MKKKNTIAWNLWCCCIQIRLQTENYTRKYKDKFGHRIPAIYWVCFQNISRMFSLKISLLGLSEKIF